MTTTPLPHVLPANAGDKSPFCVPDFPNADLVGFAGYARRADVDIVAAGSRIVVPALSPTAMLFEPVLRRSA